MEDARRVKIIRKITVLTNISLDGFFEGPGHDISSFKSDSEVFSSASGGKVETVLLGHNPYKMMKFWSTPQAREMMPEITGFMTEVKKVVVSHQPIEPGWQNVQQIHSDVPGAFER